MTNSTNMPEQSAESAKSTQSMPAEFGLPTATFVVVAGMVGAGVLTTSGYTVAFVGSNQWMLFLWVLGGITAVVVPSRSRNCRQPYPGRAETTFTSTKLTARCLPFYRAGFRFSSVLPARARPPRSRSPNIP